MAELTAHERDSLSDEEFALPGRRYPLPDEAHAKNALSRVSQFGTDDEKAKVRAAVAKKFPNIGKPTAASQPIIIEASTPFRAIAAGDMPTNVGGLPVEYMEKEVAYVGTFTDQKTDSEFTLTPERLDHWVETYEQYTAAGNPVPILPGHGSSDAERKKMGETGYGELVRLERRQEDGRDSLYAIHRFVGDDGIAAASRNNSSFYVERDKYDGAGNFYDEVMTHNAIVAKPLLPGLKPFKKIAASASAYVSIDKPFTQHGEDMDISGQLKKHLGLEDDAPDDKLSKALDRHMDTHKKIAASLSEAQRALMCSQPEGIPGAIAELRASALPVKMPDGPQQVILNRSLKSDRQAVLRAGITPAVLDEIDSTFIRRDGKLTPLACSQVGEDDMFAFKLYGILAKNAQIPGGLRKGTPMAASAGEGAGEYHDPAIPAKFDPATDQQYQMMAEENKAIAASQGK